MTSHPDDAPSHDRYSHSTLATYELGVGAAAVEERARCRACSHRVRLHAADGPLHPCEECDCRYLIHTTTLDLRCATAGCGHPLGRHDVYGCSAPVAGWPYCPCPTFEPNPTLAPVAPPPPASDDPLAWLLAGVAVTDPLIDTERWRSSLAGADYKRPRVTPLPLHSFYDLRLIGALETNPMGEYLVVSAARDERSNWFVLQEWSRANARDADGDEWLPAGDPFCVPVGWWPALAKLIDQALAAGATMTGPQETSEQRFADPFDDYDVFEDPFVVPASELSEYQRSVDAVRLTQPPPAEPEPDAEPDSGWYEDLE